jgi:hypothetical protein
MKKNNHNNSLKIRDISNSVPDRTGESFRRRKSNLYGLPEDKFFAVPFIIQLPNPEVFLLSGPLSQAIRYFLYPLRQSLNQCCPEKHHKTPSYGFPVRGV